RAIGRLAWPLFAFLMAYNVAVRGVDPRRYLKPLLLWTVVSQLPHYLAFDRFVVSILGTLLLSAAALTLLTRHARLAERSPATFLLSLLAVLFGSSLVEYGPLGVALVLAFWCAMRDPKPLSWAAALLATALTNQPWGLWPFALLALPVPFLVARL